MANTYMKLYKDEYRTIEILVRDMAEDDFLIGTAVCHIEDNVGNIVMNETIAMVIGNKVRITIPKTVTSVKGLYNVLWTINKGGYEYKHKTILNVEELS